MLQPALKTLAVLAWACVAGSYLGALHPLGDSLAVFRVPLMVIAALAVIWTTWPRALRWPLALVALGLLGWHVRARLDPGPVVHDLVLYQQNLLFDRRDSAAFLAEVARQSPDVMTLQEVSQANLPILDALGATHPAVHHCPLTPWLGEAVLSRWPMVPGTAFCSDPDGLAGMQVTTPFGAVWLVSVHLRWPWPFGQAAQVDGLIPLLETLDGPIVMAGDFNAVAASWTLRRMARASGTALVGPQVHSFARRSLPFHLGIDHVLTTPGVGPQRVVQMPLLGSDHHGILAHLSRPATN